VLLNWYEALRADYQWRYPNAIHENSYGELTLRPRSVPGAYEEYVRRVERYVGWVDAETPRMR
jgi:hypothetical protein